MRDAMCCGKRVDAFTLLEARIAESTAKVVNLRETGYPSLAEHAKAKARKAAAAAARKGDKTRAKPQHLEKVVVDASAAAPTKSVATAAEAGTPMNLTEPTRKHPFSTDMDWERAALSKAARAGIYAPSSAGFITFRSLETAAAASQQVTAAITGKSRGMTVRAHLYAVFPCAPA